MAVPPRARVVTTKGSVSRPNPKAKPVSKVTPKPPSAPPRRTSTNKRPRPATPTPTPGARPKPVAPKKPTKGKKPPFIGVPRGPLHPLPKKPTGPKTGKKGGKGGVPTQISRNYPIHPEAAPWAHSAGGEKFAPGFLRRVPQPNDDYEYRYYFLYNPYELQISTGLNADVTMDSTDLGAAYFFAGSQTISFETLVNRMPEFLATSANGGNPRHLSAAQIAELRKLGTLHDTEALYRVLNGPPQSLYDQEGANVKIVAKSADIGFISSTPVEVHFGPDAMAYVGIVNSVAIHHTSFNRGMVPLLTTIGISMTRMSGVKPAASTTTSDGSTK